ncbi:MAG: glycosyltransferase family 4 protein [Candidatus Sumerlaeota bacterium]|nr:glycosyltransferase family 4 protein [Candidatus Sumerlaeota bacterium]
MEKLAIMVNSMPPLKVAMCWAGFSGYLVACWKELAKAPSIELRVFAYTSQRPYHPDIVSGLDCTFLKTGEPNGLADMILQFDPDIIVIGGWAYPEMNGLPFHQKLVARKFVLGMDTPWRGDWRQKMARWKIGRLMDRVDAVIVAGERSWQYARHLGVAEAKIYRGFYGIDYAAFEPAYSLRQALEGGWPRSFLYIGRYIDEKGIDVLLESYKFYRSMVRNPWPLNCCGTGPWMERITQAEGVLDLGFVQPASLRTVFANQGVFVLTSRYEPWGIVIAEAAAAGLPIICTEACGASIEIVRSMYTGITVGTGDARRFARAMLWMHENHARLPEMGRRAQTFAAAYSAEAWTARWLHMFHALSQKHSHDDYLE